MEPSLRGLANGCRKATSATRPSKWTKRRCTKVLCATPFSPQNCRSGGNLFGRATELPRLRPLNPLGGDLGSIHLPHWATTGSSIDPGRGAPKDREKVE